MFLPGGWARRSATIMKKYLQILLPTILAFACGTWFGRITTPKPRIRIEGEWTTVSCGGGHYSAGVFQQINHEIPSKLADLLRKYQHEDYLVTVTPSISGYELWMAGPGKAPLWDHGRQQDLGKWVMDRMDAIQLETSTKAKSDSPGQPPTTPPNKPPAEVQPPTPTSEDAPR